MHSSVETEDQMGGWGVFLFEVEDAEVMFGTWQLCVIICKERN